MKLKTINRTILILSIILIFLLLFVNMYIRVIFKTNFFDIDVKVYEIVENIDDINILIHEGIILEQMLNDSESKYNMDNIYASYLDKILQSNTKINSIHVIIEDILLLHNSSFRKVLIDQKNIDSIIKELDQINHSLYDFQEKLFFKINENKIIELELITEESKSLHKIQDNIRNIEFKLFVFFLSVLSSFMIIIVTGLLMTNALVIKKSYGNFIFALKALEDIDKQNYDFITKLKSKAIFHEEKKLELLVRQIMNKKSIVLHIKKIIRDSIEMDNLIEQLFKETSELIQINRIGIAFVDYKNKKIMAEYGVADYNNIYLNPGHETSIDTSSLLEILIEKRIRISNDLEKDFKNKPNSRSLKTILSEGIKSNMTIPLIRNNEVIGFIFFSSKEANHFTSDHEKIIKNVIDDISGCIIKSYLIKVTFSKMSNTLAKLVDMKDNETGNHLDRMTSYALIIVRGLREKNVSGYQMDKRIELEISRYAAVHDIGKVMVPDSILNKPGKLNLDEWEVMKRHVTVGEDIFSEIREGLHIFDSALFQTAKDIIIGHHEKWDGSGYPKGLKGQEIPLVARIVAIADVFDALVSERVYKEAYPFEKAVDIIIESKAIHFDPVLVEVFNEKLEYIERMYKKYTN